ncbi:dipeptide ABC transporter ATP-binding protein [Devosia sp.]|uniref:dipeptide ABC transporter ATP-binding protein n=1 Tax=Devosia sp. TaxID=1871048 RepID=UPI002EFB0391
MPDLHAPPPRPGAAGQPDVVLSVEDLVITTTGPSPRRLVDRLSFELAAGETLCIVGESGSGKSLTSFAIMGLLPPDALKVHSGRIVLDGRNLLELSQAELRKLRAVRMSMVFQEPMTSLNPVQRVGDQIAEVIHLHEPGCSKAESRARVLRMLADVGLPDPPRIHASYPHELSGGQRQRIMIAMALILEPRLLIADEPTTALDVTTQKQILSLIKELQRARGTSVIFVTHDFGVVAEIADRILVMRRGELIEIGSRDAILSRPANDYTRALIASVPSIHPPARAPHTGETLLSVRALSKRYELGGFLSKRRQVHALKEVSLDIARDEIVGIVGESGSGKSTLARSIIGLIEPSEGEIRLGGQSLAGRCARRGIADKRRIQIVFQDPFRSLNPRARIGESLTEGLRNAGVDPAEARQRVVRMLSLVGLEAEVLERYPHQFSGGQRQRLCLARAIVMEPDILIADESVSALDVLVQEQVLDLLMDIKRRTGVAIVFITHDLRVAAQISDRIVVMQHGRIVEMGEPAAVITHPQQDYTRELIGSAPGLHWDFKNFRAYA